MKTPDQRTVIVGAKSYDAMWAEMASVLSTTEDGRPDGEGWKTTRELQQMWQLRSRHAAQERVAKGFSGSKQTPSFYYRPIQPPVPAAALVPFPSRKRRAA
jgi:hypothetical protein